MSTRRIILSAIAAMALAGGLFLYWPAGEAPEGARVSAAEVGDGERGLLLIEPALFPRDYRSASYLRAALGAYLAAAKDRGWINERTIVVFPEHVATWLVAAEAPPLAYRTQRFSTAATALIAGDPPGFLSALGRSPEDDRIAAALFRSRSRKMAANYAALFSSLAVDYGVTLVAGSIALENPMIDDGELKSRRGPIYNVSAVFASDGALAGPLVFKRHPIPSERGFAAEGSAAMPAFETPAGRLGVLICADAWHPELYDELRRRKVDIVAAPSFLSEDGAWEKPWRGYVTPKPDDVGDGAAGDLTEGEAWLAYSLPARLAAAGASTGGTAFLRGDLWDLGADGRTLAAVKEERLVGGAHPGGAITLVRF